MIITLLRKPLEGSVADNTLKHGCGAINIDATRVGTETRQSPQKDFSAIWGDKWGSGEYLPTIGSKEVSGRWPANFILIGEEAKEALDSRNEKVSEFFKQFKKGNN